jgi:hypothetical protein
MIRIPHQRKKTSDSANVNKAVRLAYTRSGKTSAMCSEGSALCENKRSRLLAPLGMTGGGTFISIRGPKARPTSLSKVITRCDACHFEEVDGGGENLRWLRIL